MKKLVFLFTAIMAMTFATSCGNTTAVAEADSTAVDTTVVDSAEVVDSAVVADSIVAE